MLLGVEKTSAQHEFFLTPYDVSEWDIFHIKNNQLIVLFIVYLINIVISNFSIYKCLMKNKIIISTSSS